MNKEKSELGTGNIPKIGDLVSMGAAPMAPIAAYANFKKLFFNGEIID